MNISRLLHILILIISVALLVAGSVCLYMSANAKEDYKNAELSVNLAGGENSKEMQKANDSRQRLDPLKSRWAKLRTSAIVCFALAVPAFAANLVLWLKKPKGKSENVRK